MTAWLDELDLHVGPPDAVMGTRSLDPARWICVDDDWLAQRDESRALVRARRSDVVAGTARDAAVELGARIDSWLVAHHPDLVDDGHIGERDPMAAAALRLAEDLCLLLPGPTGWELAAASVCFPSYWVLATKIGRPLVDVHGPVPGYAGALAARVDSFLGRLRPGQGVWRRNWSFHDDPSLYLPTHAEHAAPTPVPGGRWLRSEYQTLLRLETANAVVFTIRTQQIPLAGLAARPDRCAAFAQVLRGWSPDQRAYKGAAVDDALLTWLEDHTKPG